MQVYDSGPRLDAPQGDPAREAVSALRGYAYQLHASCLAWLALGDKAMLCIEVAEDFAVATREALAGTQVRDTAGSGRITLQSAWTREAIDSFVDLVARNAKRAVHLHYLTTSEIGVEREAANRISNGAALAYWRRAAAGADVAPLRELIMGLELADATRAHLEPLSDERFRTEFLQRVHWHCGAPGLDGIRTELEAGLIEYVATNRRLSSQAAKALVPVVLSHLLQTAVSAGSRALRRADLLTLIDEAALVAVPMEQLSAAFLGASGGPALSRETILSPAGDLPIPEVHASRASLVADLEAARRACGLGIVVGATGLGKSMIARLAARADGAMWWIADFRHLPPAETATRLSRLRAELAASASANVILDDLNGIDDPSVRDAFAQLLASLRRRDGSAIVTSYRAPTITTLQHLAPEAARPVEVRYLDEDEVSDLVAQAGGDGKFAGSVHRAAAGGHPQLTMAVLLHIRAAGWSRRSLASLLGGQMQAELGDERRAVRERLISALSDDAQTLLLRTSLVKGGFDRTLALRIAELTPGIPRAGLVLDQLVGPWVEPYRRKRLRVSPLIEDAAVDVLSSSECGAIHRTIAETLLDDKIDARDASAAMHHALRSGETLLVAAFAQSIVSCDQEMAEYLAPFLLELAFMPTDTPIFPEDAAASAMMRLAQLIVLLPFGSAEQIRACWGRLDVERLDVKAVELFEGAALSKLLLHPRTGEVLDDWVEFLLRFDRLCLAEPLMAATDAGFGIGPESRHVTGVLFAGQLRSIMTIRRFREILDRLDAEDADTRRRVFSTFRPGNPDISILVNHGWLHESKTESFDWEAAQVEYGLAAELAMRWGNLFLASRCAIAQAMCIDENGKAPDRALQCLDDWGRRIGFDNSLVRARAKILWRRRDHEAALPLFTAVAAGGRLSSVDGAHLGREAGISAAALGDWQTAQDWFDRARGAANVVEAIPSVRAMAVGLLADAAQAAFKAGRPDVAIQKLRDALRELPTIDSDGTLAEAHCHRVVRHLVLWLFREVTGRLQGEEIVYEPGAASNPEPNELIRGHPVLPLDMTFYILAEVDAALAEPTGFHRDFRDYLIEGPVLSSEISAAITDDARAIARHDPTDFVERVRRHASMSRIVNSGEVKGLADNLFDPVRGLIPLAVVDAEATDEIRLAAEDYLLSLATSAAMARDFAALDSIVAQGLADTDVSALHPLLKRIGGDEQNRPSSDREGAAIALWSVREDLSGRPLEFCWTGVWLVMNAYGSRLQAGVVGPLVAWIFAGADHLVRNARFSLSLPAVTVPPVEAVLADPERTLASASRLLLALGPAVATSFAEPVRKRLELVAEG